MVPFIVADDVVKAFGQQTVIDRLSFTIQQGEITGLLGPNGSGKTTTIRLLTGVIQRNAGRITVASYDPNDDSDAIRHNCGVLTESVDFYRHMSGLDNLLFYGRLYGITGEERPRELLDLFDLSRHAHKKVATYSTGMRRRLGLARAMLHRPSLLFLDEPTNGLDPDGAKHVLHHIKQLNAQGTTIVICSHLLNQMEAVCHRYLFIDEGRLLDAGTLEQLKQRHIRHVTLSVETNFVPESGDPLPTAVEKGTYGQYRLMFNVPGADHVPPLLRRLSTEGLLYSAEIIAADLESLYFAIRKEAGR